MEEAERVLGEVAYWMKAGDNLLRSDRENMRSQLEWMLARAAIIRLDQVRGK